MIRTPPTGVMGSVAGDDTVLLISRAPDGGSALAGRLLALASASSYPETTSDTQTTATTTPEGERS